MLRLDHPFWQAPHRPLFLFAALWALIAPSVWLVPGGFGPDPVLWHAHELLFGMGGAAVGGYLLTALPAWTGRGPISPPVTMALALLWGLARLGIAVAAQLSFAVLAVAALGYFALLLAVLARHIIAARLWRKAVLLLVISGLMVGDFTFLMRLHGKDIWPEGPVIMVLLFGFLVSFIGGRVVPAFTQSWQERAALTQPALRRLRPRHGLALPALGLLAVGGLLASQAMESAGGTCLILSGVLQAARLAGWQGLRTLRCPALFVLHAAWLWVPVGLSLIGFSMLWFDMMPTAAALHALTMGAMGAMIIAGSGRAAMARRDGALIMGRAHVLAFALVWLSALLRVLAPFAPPLLPDPIAVSAGMWMLGWALFLWAFLPALRGPVLRPVLSAPRLKPVPKTNG